MIKRLFFRWFAYFERQEVVEFLIPIQLWTYRIHQIVHRRYDSKYGKFDQAAQVEDEIKNGSSSTARDSFSRWDWRGLPRISRKFVLFERFTTCYYGLILVKNIAPEYIYTLIGWLGLPWPAHCYLFGHFVSHDLLEPQLTILFAGYELVWRSMMQICQRNYVFTLYVFLSMTDRDLKRFYALIEAERAAAFAATSAARSTSKASFGRKNSWHPSRATNFLDELNDQSSRIAMPINEQLDARTLDLFRSSLCYKIKVNSVTYHKLRPNRTPAARKLLRHHMALFALIVVGAFSYATLNVETYVHWNIFRLDRYARYYPDCGHSLKLSDTTGELMGNATRALTLHHITTIIYDSFENIILWTETGLGLVFCWASTHVLNYDAELYCHKLIEKLNRVYARILKEHHTRQMARLGPRPKELAVAKLEGSSQFRPNADVHELLVEFYDFFHQIKDIDLIVSDVIAFTIFVWLTMFVVFSETANVRKDKAGDAFFIFITVFVEMFCLVICSAGCFSLLNLDQHCMRAYKTICSIIAYGTTGEKQALKGLLDYFNNSRSSSYTIFQQHPFTRGAYLSIMSWSISCFLIIDGMRN